MSTSGIENSSLEIIEACKNDTHPPFFDLLLHYFLLLVGDSEINGRILSIVFGVMGIFATFYYTLRISKDYSISFISFALITFSFFHIYYSAEGRFYTFLYLLSLSVICQLYLFLRDQKIRQLVFFIIYATILAYTHYYGAILLFALALIVLFLWVVKEVNTKTLIYFVASGIIILLLYSPWLPYMLMRRSNVSWMSEPKVWNFFVYLYRYTGKNPVEFLFILVAIILSFKHFKSNVLLNGIFLGVILLGFFYSIYCIPYLSTYVALQIYIYILPWFYYYLSNFLVSHKNP